MELAAHEIGTGAYTTVAITAARALGLQVEDVTVTLGDSDLPPIPVAGGSNNAASTTHAAYKACKEALLALGGRGRRGAGQSAARRRSRRRLSLEDGALRGRAAAPSRWPRPCGGSA